MLARVVDEAPEGLEEAEVERQALLHTLFEERCDEDPGAVAVVEGRDRLTRAELERRANQLARHLQSLGVGPEVRVAICAERTAEMIVAMFAVLKAGGAYVPVDPLYPRERQQIILEDSQAPLLLTQERLLDRLPATTAGIVCLDRDWPVVERQSAARVARHAAHGNLAYLIYTSGSTGRPKGVAIEHRSAVALIRWAADVFPPGELACVLASTSICFDLSIFEIFLPLALGGRIVLAENALALPKLPAAGEVTLVNTVPSAISELARMGGIPPSVRVINLAGEPLRKALVDRLYSIPTVEKVYNLYGPSEDTTYSTWALMRRNDPLAPTIGRPLDGTRVHLLDSGMDLVPVEEAGELYLAGAGLARGYLGRPDLTAEKFVPDPFAERPGERLYATGDLARWRPDGDLDFLGRIDHQVKIRGFRIELGEVESALERNPAVADTVVVARESAAAEISEKVLVAYVVAAAGASLTPAGLRAWLKSSLAEHMIPSYFVLLPALPLTPNGKVDRKALPEPDRGAAVADESYVAPRTPEEAALAAIWAEVLELPRVGAEDDFFVLGGQSIVATRILARVRDAFGIELPARTLFDAPTVARLAARLAGEKPAATELPRLVPASRERLETSASQEGMWFADRLNPAFPLFNIPLQLTLRGPLDAAVLQRALSEVVNRHKALQMVFREEDGRLRPVLSGATEVELPVIDLRLLPDPAPAADARAADEARRRIDLKEGPLLRALLLRTAEREHRLVLVLHHIVGDDWSTWVLVRELAALYAAFVADRPLPLAGLPVQYADFAAWQRDWLETPEAGEQIRFWKEHLAGAPKLTELPMDRPRPAAQSFEGSRLTATVPAAAVEALAGLARRQGATLFMALLAAFQALVHRQTGREDLVVGSPIAGRRLPQVQDLIGLFTNNLSWRGDLTGEPAFLDLLARVREDVLEGTERQGVPFDRLLREIQPERNLSHSPVAQLAIALQNTPPPPRELAPGLGLELRELGNGTSKLDLIGYLRQTDAGLVGDWEYASRLFDAATIARLAGHFRALINAAASHPEARLADLPMLEEPERHQALVEWNDTAAPFQHEACVHELFAARAAEAPGAVALVAPGRSLTRGELQERAQELARHLRQLGVGPEARVAVAAERSPEMVIALLGILQAGGAYVPLDPNYPAERLAWMLEDSGATVLLTQSHLVPKLPTFGGTVVLLDAELPEAPVGMSHQVTPDNAAYVIYTSGSTGRPKGVVVSHRSLVNLAEAQIRLFELAPGSRQLQFASFSFDASVSEIFTALLSGAELHLASRDELLPGPALARTVRERGITVVTLAPSALAALEAADGGRLPSVRTLIVAGEACPPALAARWSAGRRLVDAYGPTETTVCATATVIGAGETVSIGRPVANARVVVLGPGATPAPIGVPGEIAIGGTGVARGYLGRPDLTAERFVPDVDPRRAHEPGARAYLSGDLGRLLPDGRIEYLGRRDDQVKVRGFRIELGEIEAALTRQPEVREAAVVVREEPGATGVDRRLVACLVPVDRTDPTDPTDRSDLISDLRSRLAAELPDYMIPGGWIVLPALPLTPNGKVDRRALSRMETVAAAADAYVPPAGPVEEVLAGIWAEVLGIDRVGTHDRFFDLGGHSLLATQVLSRIRQALGAELPMHAFFAEPTVAGLARQVEAVRREGPAAPPIEPAPHDAALPLSFSQSRLWLLDRLEPGSPLYNIPQVLALLGPLDIAALRAALSEVVRRHEVLRTRFETVDGRPLQVVVPASPLGLPVVDLGTLPAELRRTEADRLAGEDARRPFDLAHPPLLRATVYRLEPEEHRLVLVSHHIASDGWSQGVLAREVSALYAAEPLPELPIQYADFARWQQRWLSGARLAEQIASWRQRLDGAPTVLELPLDRPRPASRGTRGDELDIEYPRELSQGVRRLARRLSGTPFMVLLAAFEALLHRYTGAECLLIGTPIAGRNRAELESLIGFFVNTLVLRADFGGDPSFAGLLARAREVTLDAHVHQDLPFEKLVEELRPERDLAHTPLFQVMLAVQNVPLVPPALPGVAVEVLPVDRGTAKFDLSLFLIDSDEGIGASFEYATEIFDRATIVRWAGHFETLLAGAVASPETPVSVLPLLGDAERAQLLIEWNDVGDLDSTPLCLHQLFEAQAARTPDAEALVHPRERLTYRELDRRASLLAAHLRDLGVGPEILCGVLMDRTPELVIALLAILKAGGAYVPLDPNYPASRVRLMLEISRAAVLLTKRDLAAELETAARMVFLDEEIGAGSAGILPALPGNLAYLIFTSGSTGLPKGVALEHENAVSFVHWAWDVFPPEDLAGVLAATSICFDLSVFELFVPLSRGGKVILADNALHLASLPAADEVTLINTVPSAMAELVLDAAVPPSVRTVNLAGEPLKNALAQEIYGRTSIGRLLNLYGPSEDTTYSTFAPVRRGSERPPTIGRPIAGSSAYVLDSSLRPVPQGIPGALYLAGAGLARGYYGRPELTADRFVPDPFAVQPGERLYKTGDLVRTRADGEMDFLGRIDHQVKVRGFRIELGEVEGALAALPRVREAVVLALAEGEGAEERLRLVAFLAAGEPAPAPADLRDALKQKLPEYMVPTTFVVLPALPLTPNGKIDRKALARLGAETVRPGEEDLAPPRDEIEKHLAEIWAEVFGVERVGIHQNFFDLGGHSLLAAQVLAQVRKRLGADLPLKRLFEAPTVAKLAEAVEAAAEEAFEALLVEAGDSGETGAPLSFAQRRLWFLDRMTPGLAVYNLPYPVRIEGTLDAAVLERALAEVVRRHGSLRTTIRMVNGRPVQVAAPAGRLSLPRVDLCDLPDRTDRSDRSDRSDQLGRLIREESSRPFDLEAGPLLRAVLVRSSARDHALLLTLHHIVSDGWSMAVLLAELGAIYEAFALGRPSPLPELPVQYADYARWQRKHLRGEAREAQLAFWRERLAGAPAVLELPTDRPRPGSQSFRGSQREAELPPRLAAPLRDLARGEGVTLFMLLLAAFDTLLFRITGQEDLLVGAPVANRSRPELDGLIGFFANTLVLRAQVSGELAFRELLRAVRETALAAYAHQDLPFDTLVEELRPERDPSRSPLFQVALTVEGAPRRDPRPAGLRFHPLPVDTGTAKFDLTLQVADTGAGLGATLEYASDLFEAATAGRLLGLFERLLEGIAADPAAPLLDLPLLSAAERHQAVVEWNDSRSGIPREAVVHELFAAWAERTPGAVAVEQGSRTLTYGELAAKAGLLAGRLRALGVGPEVPVALLLERSPELIVAVLAVLQAGGAYAPLDPNAPPERLGFLLEDTKAPVLLAHDRLLDRLPGHAARLILLDEGWEEALTSGETAPIPPILRPSAAAGSLAYVMYTSGTTGRPKGVAVPHGAILRLVRNTNYARLDADEAILQLGPVAFDASTFEIWGALANGGRLVLYPGDRPSLEELDATLARHGVTSLFITTGLFHQMAEHRPAAFARVRQLLTGGEVLSPRHMRMVLEAAPDCRLIACYGPTENTTFTTTTWIAGPADVRDTVPLGRPIANSRAMVLDPALRSVPVGVPGQLYTGGEGLARGYLGRPELTAERFVPDPLAEPGGRLYATGDLARWLPDGRLDFLGRIDQQVKIRGFRIELPEIEAVLASHRAVAEAVVLLRVFSEADKRLVAYVVPREGMERPEPAELRTMAQERLPEPMVPAAWVFLDALPLTANSKVDRRALARIEPSLERGSVRGTRVAPRNRAEAEVARIWAEVLKTVEVGVHDNFFELGGHSLLATQVVSRLRDVLGVELPLKRLWETPTVAGLAAGLDAETEAGTDRLPPILPVPRQERMPRMPRIPLSFAQRRLWFLEHLSPGLPLYNIPSPLRIEGGLDPAVLARALSEVVRRHESLRTTFGADEGEPYQVIGPPGPVPLPAIDLSALASAGRTAELERQVREEALRPFNLETGPLFRALLLRLDSTEHVLMLAMHHIVSDGWSMDILLDEITEAYDAFAAGRMPARPELPIQYADFAVWQLQHLKDAVFEEQAAWWQERLGDAPAALELPTDRPRPPVQTSHGASLAISLSPAVSAAVQDACRRDGVTLFMWMLAAFDALLARHAGQEDLVVGSPIANRNRGEIEGLIGFFVNTLAMRTDLAGNPSFRELLRRSRDTALGAYAHQDLPFETLVEKLRLERDLSRSPLFQVMLSVHSARREPASSGGLRLQPLEVESWIAKFDLSLVVVEEESLQVGIEYNTDLYDATTILRRLERFALLVESAAADPGLRLADLPQQTLAERHQVLVEWNDTRPDRIEEATVIERFAARAQAVPESPALLFLDRRMTFGELDRAADRVAHRLAALGVGPGSVVGLFVERSPEMVAALLGVWKAGGAYLPLDPAYPDARLAFLMQDAFGKLTSPVLLVEESLDERASALAPEGVSRLALRDALSGTAGEDTFAPRAQPGEPAYLIYTSGTTGNPKAVVVEHRNLAATMAAAEHAFAFSADDRMPCLAPFSFDIFLFELLGPLLAGGTSVLFGLRPTLDLGALVARLGELTMIHAVPALKRQLLETARVHGTYPGVRAVFVGGDAVPHDLLVDLPEVFPRARINVLYGPTEATIICCSQLVSASDIPSFGTPIGRPLDQSEIRLLDRWGRPAPLGVVGEICIGGTGVTRGYLGRPELDAEKFPVFEDGRRWYRSGDLARHRPDGHLEFLGRLDHQVKIRGFRIELGEIENALAGHPDVREALVLALREPGGAERALRLVAFLVPEEGTSPDVADLKEHLRGRLPEYMIPAVFHTLDALPVTANGKVDRQALQRLDAQVAAPAATVSTAPSTPVEQALARIWQEVFRVPTVGLEDNFFDLGGHSLLAMRVVARIRSVLGVELPVQRLFEAPTLGSLAARIERERAERRATPPPIVPVSREERIPLSFAQRRLWLLDQVAPGSPVFNVPCPIGLDGPLDTAALAAALAEIVRRHESLRTAFPSHAGQPWQKVLPAVPPALPHVDLTALPADRRESEAERVAWVEGKLPFDLARGPMVRTALLRLGPARHMLLFSLHHIVTDGWSTDVLLRELVALHDAFAAGRPSPLPELQIQYPDYAAWQRRWLDGPALTMLLADWKNRFGSDLPVLQLPTDRPRPPLQPTAGDFLSRTLPADLEQRVRALSQRAGATPFMTLLAGFQALLQRYTGQDRIVVGTPVAGRDRAELEGMIGFFVNTVVLPGDLAGDPTFLQVVERARQTALGAFACQELPFEKLVENLQPERDRSRSPLFQVMFALQNLPPAPPSLGGLSAAPLGVGTGTAQFDLTLYMAETPDGLLAGAEYATALFEPATIERLLAAYQSVLEAVTARPETRLSELAVAPLVEATRPVEPPAPAAAASSAEARRAKLLERQSRLSDEQRRRLEERLRGQAPAASSIPAPATGKLLVEITPGAPGRRPFFCIHPAGGDVLCFFPLARHVGEGQPFWGIQSRGLDSGEPFATLEEMAACYVDEIRKVQPSGPYRLGGWSFGGLAAFEVARQLESQGEKVELLAVIDTAPGLPEGTPETERITPALADESDHTAWLLDIAAYVRGLRGKDLGITAADLAGKSGEEQLALVVARLQAAGILHAGDSFDQVRRLLRVYRTNVRAYRTYQPHPYAGPVTLFLSTDMARDPADPALGWSRLTPRPVEVHELAGGHITLLAEPHVRTLAERLRSCLETI